MPDHRTAEAHFLRGMEAIGRKDIVAAADSFRRAVREESSYVDALFNLGRACKDLGRLDEARDVALPLEQYTALDRRERDELVALKLAQVELAGFEDFFPAELSGGMRKRAGLARATGMR